MSGRKENSRKAEILSLKVDGVLFPEICTVVKSDKMREKKKRESHWKERKKDKKKDLVNLNT